MLKKSLMFFSVVFLAGTLLIGCSNPTAGKDGKDGLDGGNSGGGNSSGGGGGNETVLIPLTGERTTADIQEAIDDTGAVTASGLI
jgi:predicted small secreted protein